MLENFVLAQISENGQRHLQRENCRMRVGELKACCETCGSKSSKNISKNCFCSSSASIGKENVVLSGNGCVADGVMRMERRA